MSNNENSSHQLVSEGLADWMEVNLEDAVGLFLTQHEYLSNSEAEAIENEFKQLAQKVMNSLRNGDFNDK